MSLTVLRLSNSVLIVHGPQSQKKMEVMMEMIMQLQDESFRKRKVGDEDVGSVEESSKMRMKKRTCVETVEEY